MRPAAKHFSAMLFSSSSRIEFSTALHAKDRALLSLLMHSVPSIVEQSSQAYMETSMMDSGPASMHDNESNAARDLSKRTSEHSKEAALNCRPSPASGSAGGRDAGERELRRQALLRRAAALQSQKADLDSELAALAAEAADVISDPERKQLRQMLGELGADGGEVGGRAVCPLCMNRFPRMEARPLFSAYDRAARPRTSTSP